MSKLGELKWIHTPTK